MRFTTPYQTISDDEPPTRNIGASVKQVLSAAGRYAGARARLLALEGKLAARSMKIGLLMMGTAAVFLALALTALTAAAALALVQWLPQAHGAMACLVTAGALILIAVLLVWRGRKSLTGHDFFPATKSEFNRDKQWLQNHPPVAHGPNGSH